MHRGFTHASDPESLQKCAPNVKETPTVALVDHHHHHHHRTPLPQPLKHRIASPSFTTTAGVEQELTIESVGDLSKFPLLDSFHWEILRLFPAPPFFFKVSDAVQPPPTLATTMVAPHFQNVSESNEEVANDRLYFQSLFR